MKNIEVKILNPDVINDSLRMAVAMARFTQRGHEIHSMADLETLLDKPYSASLVNTLVGLPHPTLQKFAAINVAIVGLSRRALAQITRHQNEVKFMSTSLQYSDYSENSSFVLPYELIQKEGYQELFYQECERSMLAYKRLTDYGVDNDTAGYVSPQALRGALVVSATPYQWNHMIGQRVCRRNTDETRYIFLRIWEQLYNMEPSFFSKGPFCRTGPCLEGKMACGSQPPRLFGPRDYLAEDFRLLYYTEEQLKEDPIYDN